MIKKLIDKLKRRFYDMALSNKLLVSYFTVTLVPFTLFACIFYSNVINSEEKKMEYSASQSFAQIKSVLEFKTKYINDSVDVLSMDDYLQKIMRTKFDEYADNYGQQLIDVDKLMKQVNNIQNKEGIVKIRFYMRKGLLYSNEGKTFFTVDDVIERSWYKRLLEQKNKNLWCTPQDFAYEKGNFKNVIPMVKNIKNLDDLNQNIGIVRFDLAESDIKDLLIKGRPINTSSVLIFNSSNEIVCSSGEEKGNGLVELPIMRVIYQHAKQTWTKVKLNGNDNMLQIKNINGTDWSMAMIIPYSDIHASIKTMRYKMISLILVLILLAYISAFFIARTNTKRLMNFLKVMRKVERGDLSVQIESGNLDEIGELEHNFNQMLSRIRVLIEEEFNLGKKVKSAELKALQAQINPHFLYNTLDLINWYSFMDRGEELRELVVSLSNFYKLSLSRGEEIIPLEDEIEHVKAYMDIQNKRYDNAIKLNIHVEDGLKEYKILKIILQPIVENSILHGIMEKKEKRGEINIDAKLREGALILTVIDDGVGMDENRLKEVQEGRYVSSSSSYGIRNIKERLKTLHGDGVDIVYESKVGIGTCVQIIIHDIRK